MIYNIMFYAGMAGVVIFIIISAVYFVKADIYKVICDITGASLKKSVKKRKVPTLGMDRDVNTISISRGIDLSGTIKRNESTVLDRKSKYEGETTILFNDSKDGVDTDYVEEINVIITHSDETIE